MERIGKGDEASIYKYNKNMVLKMYKNRFPVQKMEREYNFLHKYQKTGVVPKLYSTISDVRDLGIIAMEYLDGYITLKEFIKNKSDYTADQCVILLKAILKARYAIGVDQEYKDLHSNNVMVKITANRASVKMIDPGTIVDHQGSPVWLNWMLEITKEMRMVKKNPLGNAINKQNLSKIKTFLS